MQKIIVRAIAIGALGTGFAQAGRIALTGTITDPTQE